MRKAALLLAMVAILSGCITSTLNRSERLNPSSLFEDDSDIGRTFLGATMVLPTSSREPLVTRFEEHDVWQPHVRRFAAPVPAVVFMHGCTGLRNMEPLKALARAGFAVIAPDSFARRFRPLQCRPSERRGGENIYVYDFRLAEISYGLHRMAALSWIDSTRLFLMGVSEGGVAAALYRGEDFRARVIAQWTCHGRPFVSGLAAGPREPVLAIVRSNDPWYDSSRTRDQKGDCGAFFKERHSSASLVLEGGDKHDVFDEPTVVHKVVDFLRVQAAQPPNLTK